MNKRAFILIFFICLVSFSFSQNLNNLDKDNGFMHFKMGSDTASFAGSIVYQNEMINKQMEIVKTYKPKNPIQIGGANSSIYLDFVNNKLKNISIFILHT